MACDELLGLFECFIELFFLHWHQMLIGHIVNETQVFMSTSTLLFVKQLGSISDHLYVKEIFIYFCIKQTNFTLLQLKLFIHVYLTAPYIALESSEHFLACHFKKITHMDVLVIFRDHEIGVKKVIFGFTVFDMIYFTDIFGDR